MVFYHYDFVEGSPQLNVRGHDKLARLAKVLPTSFCPVVIERTPETPGLDERRRGIVLAGLTDFQFPVPPERVVIGPPVAAGMAGFESIFVYGNQLSALQAGAAAGVGGYAGSQGFTGGGLSSGAISSGLGFGGLGR
jgi:hypothetical protein